MIRQLFGALSALVLAGALISGCQSAPAEPESEPVVAQPVVPPPPPPPPETKPEPPFNELGQVVDPVTRQPLNTTFYFEYDQARLAQDDIRVLAVHAGILREFRSYSVAIEGHCDERGTNEYNLALGDRRATAARDFLMNQGVPAGKLTTISYGEERPQCSESDESCWQRNRRAHFSAAR